MPQRLSDATSAAMVVLHTEQRSESSEQFVPGVASDQEHAKMETSLARLPFGHHLSSVSTALRFPHKPQLFLWEAIITICIRLGHPQVITTPVSTTTRVSKPECSIAM